MLKIVIIGRTETLFKSMKVAIANGDKVVGIITCKEAPEYKITRKHYQQFAEINNIPFLTATKLDTTEALSFLHKLEPPDVSISMNFSGIIAKLVTDIFPLGILNAHGGDLPRYRGNACQAWAIINGEDRIGLCIHRMIGGELDTGDIIARSYFPLNINTQIGEFHDWSNVEIPELFVTALRHLNKNPKYILERQSKDPKVALRCYPRRPSDSRIDWNKSAIEILRLINASGRPYSGAFSTYKGEKVTISGAEITFLNEEYLAVPGQIARIDDDGSCVVITGEGELRITRINKDMKIKYPSSIITSLRDRLE